MKVRKVLLILIAMMLVALSMVSCGNKEESDPASYYRSISSRGALRSASKVSLGGYAFESFLNRGEIKISEKRGDITYYGVLSGRGDSILPVSYTTILASGDFLIAEGGEETSRRIVYSYSGKELYSATEAYDVSDVGGGLFSVKTRTASHLYNGEGAEVLPGTSLDQTYDYSACGDYVIARSGERGRTFVFHARTSDLVYSFFDSSNRNHLVAYVGGKDFIVVYTDKLESAEGCDVEIKRDEGTVYYKQSVYRYTVGVAEPTPLTPGKFIVKINNKYSIGVTEYERENYSLLDGYNAVSYYVTDGRVASGALNHYIADGALSTLKALPEGVSALYVPVDGVTAVVSKEGAILYLDESAEVFCRIADAAYQDVVFSGGMVVASKIVASGVVRRGGFDLEGHNVIPFEYSYISAFVGGKAIATKDGKAYVITTTGSETYIGDFSMPYYFDGFYQIERGGYVGAMSFDGVELIPASYTAFAAVTRYEETVYVALTLGDVADVYRLY